MDQVEVKPDQKVEIVKALAQASDTNLQYSRDHGFKQAEQKVDIVNQGLDQLVQTSNGGPLDYSRQHGFERNSVDVSREGMVY